MCGVKERYEIALKDRDARDCATLFWSIVKSDFETYANEKVPNKKTKLKREYSSNHRGVSWYKRTSKWVAQIKIKGVRKTYRVLSFRGQGR